MPFLLSLRYPIRDRCPCPAYLRPVMTGRHPRTPGAYSCSFVEQYAVTFTVFRFSALGNGYMMTLSTSSMEVMPCLALMKPSSRSVLMPSDLAISAISTWGALRATRCSMFSVTSSTS